MIFRKEGESYLQAENKLGRHKTSTGLFCIGSWMISEDRHAKDTFMRMKGTLTNMKVGMATHLKVLKYYVYPVMLYGSECWTMSRNMKK